MFKRFRRRKRKNLSAPSLDLGSSSVLDDLLMIIAIQDLLDMLSD